MSGRQVGRSRILSDRRHHINRNRSVHVAARNGARRVRLALLPVRVFPSLILAVQREIGTALGLPAALLLDARPRLVDQELARGTRKGKGGYYSGRGLGAFVDKVAVEEVVELA